MAQPPLSQAIRKLEGELGVQLFDRTSRAVAATDAGRVFAEEARKVLAAFELAVAETRRAGGGSSTLRIGSSPYVAIGLLHDASSRRRIEEELHASEERYRSVIEALNDGVLIQTDDGRAVQSAGMLRKALQYQRLCGGDWAEDRNAGS